MRAPHFGAIFGAALGHGKRVHYIQHPLQRTIRLPAILAVFQVPVGQEGIALFAVVMQNQLFFR